MKIAKWKIFSLSTVMNEKHEKRFDKIEHKWMTGRHVGHRKLMKNNLSTEFNYDAKVLLRWRERELQYGCNFNRK